MREKHQEKQELTVRHNYKIVRTSLILCCSGPTDPNFGKSHSIMIVSVDLSPRKSGKAWITSEYDITLQANSFFASDEIVSATRLEIRKHTADEYVYIASDERFL